MATANASPICHVVVTIKARKCPERGRIERRNTRNSARASLEVKILMRSLKISRDTIHPNRAVVSTDTLELTVP